MTIQSITEIRILPPLAVGRLGSSPSPMDNYDFDGFIPAEDVPESDDVKLGYRKLVPARTLVVDRESGTIVNHVTPAGKPQFRDEDGRIRPICPFLEVWAIIDGKGPLQPLTIHHLDALGLDATAVIWNVTAENSKAYRRTGDPHDRIVAETMDFSGHTVQDFVGTCDNFRSMKSIHLGAVQYIRPTEEFPEIRLRFTPAPGKVYGPVKDETTGSVDDVYDPGKGHWPGYYDGQKGTQYPTKPASIFYGREEKVGDSKEWVSYGYLDDMCDGIVHVRIDGTSLKTYSRISVGPPDFAPDSLPVRAVSDELAQIADGPEVSEAVTKEEAEDIVRRALESVRLLYATAMNGNAIMVNGMNHNTNNMAVQNFRDTGGETRKKKLPNGEDDPDAPIEPIPGTGRAWSPLFNPPAGNYIVNREVTKAHRQLLLKILNGQPLPITLQYRLRDFTEVGQYGDQLRLKMPGLMRNADGMLLALTRRMKSVIAQTANPYAPSKPPAPSGKIDPLNRTAQLTHRSTGNPPGTLLTTAVSNNFPGLEFDYRSIWRNVFKGLVMYEAGPRVIHVAPDSEAAKAGIKKDMLMLRADDQLLWAEVKGPKDESSPTVQEEFPTQGLEWSNALADIIQKAEKNPGLKIKCDFVEAPGEDYKLSTLQKQPVTSAQLEIRPMFAEELGAGNAVFGKEISEPGDLTQGLCSPWQNDYRECSCYYWAAARPDFVNRKMEGGEIVGDNWLQKTYDDHYEVDDRTSRSQLEKFVSYTDLFRSWEKQLRFVIAGQAEPRDDDQ